MSDNEEPPTKVSKFETSNVNEADEDMEEEVQEEWLSEGLLTDDDLNPPIDEDQTDSNLSSHDEAQESVLSVNTSMEANTQQKKKTENTDIEKTLTSMNNQSQMSDDLDTFLIRKTDGKVLATKDDVTDDGNDTDDLLRLLGEDDEKSKKKVLVKTKDKRSKENGGSGQDANEKAKPRHDSASTDEDDDYIYESSKLTKLRVAKSALIRKYPAAKAVPEDMSDGDDDETDASSDEAKTMKKMFGVSKKPANLSKTDSKQPQIQIKSMPKKIIQITPKEVEQTSPPPKRQLRSTTVLSNPSPNTVVKQLTQLNVKTPQPNVKASQPNVKTPQSNVKASQPNVKASQPNVKASQPNVKASQPNVKASQPNVKASPQPQVKASPKPNIKAPQPNIKASPQLNVKASPQPNVKQAVKINVKPSPQPTFKPSPKLNIKPSPQPNVRPSPKPNVKPSPQPNVKPSPQPSVKLSSELTVKPAQQPLISYKPVLRTVPKAPTKTTPKPVGKEIQAPSSEHEEIINEEEFLEDDDFDLDEDFADASDSELEASRDHQRIMRPEQMDEEIPTDAETDSEEGSLYDELPSSDSDDLDDWFTLDIRAERAADYLPLLGTKALELLTEEKRRVTERLSSLRARAQELSESGRQQDELIRKASMTLTELDDMLKAA